MRTECPPHSLVVPELVVKHGMVLTNAKAGCGFRSSSSIQMYEISSSVLQPSGTAKIVTVPPICLP